MCGRRLQIDVAILELESLANLVITSKVDQHILGLEIGVNDAAFPVEEIKTDEHLLCDLLDEKHGNAAVVPGLDEIKHVLAQDLKDHTDMGAVRAVMDEVVEEVDDVLVAGVVASLLLRIRDTGEQLDLILCRRSVMFGRSDDF